MGEVLTREEMEKRFDGEWVLVGDPELTDMNDVVRGEVLCHSKDRGEVYRSMREAEAKHVATLCFAKVPEDTVIIL